jgi:hypothetical protein
MGKIYVFRNDELRIVIGCGKNSLEFMVYIYINIWEIIYE